ncbi:MAG: polyketide synthase dehydratase domain-containing protein, partial [Kiloniellales bacterium]|nr:polyketide synthase dehydratase domain-containing protein [Kiloniellales bacterium]
MSENRASSDLIGACTAQAWTLGADIDFTRYLDGTEVAADLPVYPWQHEDYWFRLTPEASGGSLERCDGPFLGKALSRGLPVWESEVGCGRFPFLGDHAIEGAAVFPATGFIEVVLEAAHAFLGHERIAIENFEIRRPLLLEGENAQILRTALDPKDGSFRIESRLRLSEDPWTLNAEGRISELPEPGSSPRHPDENRHDAQSGKTKHVTAERHYAFTQRLGMDYGPGFQCLKEVRVKGQTAEVILELPASQTSGSPDFLLHPSLFDGALQGLFSLLKVGVSKDDDQSLFLPSRFDRLGFFGNGECKCCHILVNKVTARSVAASFTLLDDAAGVIAYVDNFLFRRMDRKAETASLGRYTVRQTPLAGPGGFPIALPCSSEDSFKPIHGLEQSEHFTKDLNVLAANFAHRALRQIDESTVLAAVKGDDIAIKLGLLESCWRLEELCEHDASKDQNPSGGEKDVWKSWQNLFNRWPEGLAEVLQLGRAGSCLTQYLSADSGTMPQASASLLDQLQNGSLSTRPLKSFL